jgi:YidC/Oxa1 family membrane protein insertase
VIALFDSFRDTLYYVLKFFQGLTEPILGSQSFWFSIVLLTVAVRILLIPLTVKQVRSTRVMQELAPEIKKLQAKHKNDRQKLNEEMMALYKERGFNPLAGCWPLLAQMPFFFALYRVIYSSRVAGEPNILLGKTFFGVPLETHWFQLPDWGARLGSVAGLTIIGLVALMAVTTYVSQRQLMSRQTAQVNPQQQTLMKVMPLMFFVFGFNVPLAVIIYWVTTNFWSVGQQYFLLRSQTAPAAAAAAAPAATEGEAPRRRLGPLSMFRSSAEPRQSTQAGGKNGSGPEQRGDKPAPRQGKSGTAQPDARKSGPEQPDARKGGQTRSTQPGRSGSGGGRKPSSGRSAGKGKASGPRRGKR